MSVFMIGSIFCKLECAVTKLISLHVESHLYTTRMTKKYTRSTTDAYLDASSISVANNKQRSCLHTVLVYQAALPQMIDESLGRVSVVCNPPSSTLTIFVRLICWNCICRRVPTHTDKQISLQMGEKTTWFDKGFNFQFKNTVSLTLTSLLPLRLSYRPSRKCCAFRFRFV